ncbi:NAD(P)H-dependent oxidoreductase [Lentiprolixibacter aurantiacus]|uniref:NAD(P)H-dependent oxidoreductase n=1 Tax=Lentiprolixibacter aurantiacus TaxID=2993939 RepID=A0AAE3MLL4_9FLAO|nr:NAD(P)H-dependent oxidoreductase [Lentiprolixibacter aurantiacus]MCX2720020.1 NAD(P)H-dependent oxidoreductase [Lentiprolixibacter aurantiacus]
MKLLENLNWRYATKKFDPSRKISPGDLEKIKEAIRLSASSYGLQLYKVLVIEDHEIRKTLKEASWGQTQITDASHLFVFCNTAQVKASDIDDYLELKANTQNLDVGNLKGYGDFMKDKLTSLSPEAQKNWTARQTYIALGNFLAACAELHIDSCPMEGFEPEQYDEILGLKEKGLTAAVVATAGYRSKEDQTQGMAKVRKSADQLFETI